MGSSGYSFVNSFRTWLHHRRLRKANSQHGFTVVVNAHREGIYLGPSLRSTFEAAHPLLNKGIPVDLVLVMDRSDSLTRDVARRVLKDSPLPTRVIRLGVGDLGSARNVAVKAARLPWIAFLDGDDLWAVNWLLTVHGAIGQSGSNQKTIYHPRFNFTFQQVLGLLESPSQCDLDQPLATLVADNLWTSLACAHRSIFLAHPYPCNRLSEGLGYEDWSWNRRTIQAGFQHVALDGTCHFIRRRGGSLSRRSIQHDVLATP